MADFPEAAECESRYSNIDDKCYATAGSRVGADNFRYMTSEGKQRRRLKRRKKSNFGNCRRSKRRRMSNKEDEELSPIFFYNDSIKMFKKRAPKFE